MFSGKEAVSPPHSDRELEKPLHDIPHISPVYMILTDPNFSLAAKVFYIFDILMVAWSVISYLLQSDLNVNTADSVATFFGMETAVTVYFTVELFVRLYFSPNRRKFCQKAYNILDFLSVAPYFIILITVGASGENLYLGMVGATSDTNAFFKVMKMLRIVRLIRLLRHNKSMNVMFSAFRISGDGMMMLAAVYMISIVFFSSLEFHMETTICEIGTVSKVSDISNRLFFY